MCIRDRYSGGEQFSLPRQYTFRDPDDIGADTAAYDARSISRTNREQPGYYVSGSATYTHAFGRRSRMSADYRVTYAANRVNRRTVLFDNKTGMFGPEPDPRQSTDYDYDYLTQRAGLSYQYFFKKTKVAASVYYQHVDFEMCIRDRRWTDRALRKAVPAVCGSPCRGRPDPR